MPPAGACPYVGLETFKEEDRDYFFGREREIKIISANIYTSHVTILYGPSGAGKSSVLRAGVIPYLEASARAPRSPAAAETVIVYFNRWQDEAFLSQLKRQVASKIEAGKRHRLTTDTNAPLEDLLYAAGEAHGGSVLVILDQFEEYLVYHPESEDENGFEAELASAVNSSDVDATFLITLREDLLAHLQRFDVRIPNLFGNQLRLHPLSRAAAEAAIRSPLKVYNQRLTPADRELSIDDDLVQAIIDEAAITSLPGDTGGAGQAPASEDSGRVEPSLVQLVMVRLWQEAVDAGSDRITLATFRKLGGVKQIGEQHLTTVLDRLSDTQRDVADRVFRHLVMPRGTKIAQTTDDLVLIAEDREEVVRSTLEALSSTRILLRSYPPEKYEITHDVLCPAVLEWRRKRATKAAEQRAEQEAHAARRFRRLSVALAVMLLLATITAVVAGSLWLQSRSRELAAAAIAELPTDPERSIVLALAAFNTRGTREAEEALHRSLLASRVRLTLQPHAKPLRQAVFSPDGTSVATASLDGSVRLWGTASGKPLRAFENAHRDGVLAVVFMPDSCCLVTAGLDHTAKIWDISSGGNKIVLSGHRQPVSGLAVSSNGLIATASWDGTARIWEARTGTPVGVITVGSQETQLNSVAFSPDARFLATADTDGNVKVWVTQTQQLVISIPLGFSAQVVTFTRDGAFLAAAANRTVHIWNTQDWKQVVARTAHGAAVHSIAFSPNGRRVATASQDHTVKIWPLQMDLEELTFPGHSDSVRSVAFSPDGSSVVTASEDRTARVWTATPTGEDLAIHVGTELLRTIAFSPEGDRIVSQGPEGTTAVIWDAHTGEKRQTFVGHTGDVLDARFDANGTRIATGSRDRTVRLWDAASAQEILSLPTDGWVYSLAFDPSGKWLAASAHSRIHLWNLDSPASPGESSQHSDVVNQLLFSPDGRRIASASSDHSVQIWEPRTRTLPFRHQEDRNFYSVAFFPDGRSVVAGADDGSLRVWRFGEGRTERIPQKHMRAVQRVVFSPDGKRMASAGADRTVQIWDSVSRDNILTLQGHGGEVSDIAFSRDGTRLLTAANDGAIRGFWIDSRRLREFASKRVTRTDLLEELRRNSASILSHLWRFWD